MPGSETTIQATRRRGAHLLAVLGDISSRASQRVAIGSGPTLKGDRWVEWGFVLARIPDGSGSVLDFGADVGFLSFSAAERGHEVVAFDRLPPALDYDHPRVKPVEGDVLTHDFGGQSFDLIINCSSVEHVGLAGRYGSFDRENGDIEAMGILRGLLKPGGKMVLTIPVGRDGIFAPQHRVYGEQRLPRLLDGFEIAEERFWRKRGPHWTRVGRADALAEESSERFYALGLFVLSR
jgi:SAM-dependent methyltransferase